MTCSVDVGTYNLVVSRRGEDGKVESAKEINAFITIPLDNPFTYQMLEKANVKSIKREKVAYIVGEAAVNMAYTLNLPLKRPMKDGCLNPQEKEAFQILSIMIHSLIGEVENDNEIVYYSVPANAINRETDATFHQKVLGDIFKKYKVKNKSLTARPLNEGLALVFAELGHKNYTGLGASFGAGMVNICYAIFSQPVFQVSVTGSGDWLDHQVSRATGETEVVINKEKTKIDLLKPPTNMIERAIITQYRILIENAVTNIKKCILDAGNKIKSENPLDIVIGGGTASPNGFEQLFKETLSQADFPLPIGEITKPEDHLYAVARGCLLAAEVSETG